MDILAISVFIIGVIFVLFLAGLVCVDRYGNRVQINKKTKYYNCIFIIEILILSLSLYLNLYFSIYSSFGDTLYFVNVMEDLTEQGFWGLYQNGEIAYPPFFQYFFWIMAWLMKHLGIAFDNVSRLYIFCVKLPCIICEFLSAGIIYKTIKKHNEDGKCAIALFLCLLNPGILFTTAYICQVDMLYIFWMILSVYLIINRHLKLSYFVFATAVLFKFQAVFITPVIAFAVLTQVILQDFDWKRFFQHLTAGLLAIGMIFASYIPFIYNFKTGEIAAGGFFNNFINTSAGHVAASQNACNFWMLFGYNEISQEELFGPLSCQAWSSLFIVMLVILSSILYWKHKKDITIYPMLAALLVSGTYCFAVRMMGRYLYPAIFLLFLGYACRPSSKRLISTALFSFVYILEIGFDYIVYPWITHHNGLFAPRLISGFTLICFGYLVYAIWSEKKENEFEIRECT